MENYVERLLADTLPATLQYRRLQQRLALPETAADGVLFRKLDAQSRSLKGWADAHDALQQAQEALERNRAEQRTASSDLLPLYREEEEALGSRLALCVQDVQALLAFGTVGGDLPCELTLRPESAVSADFAKQLGGMYRRYLASCGIDSVESQSAKNVVLAVSKGGYGRLRYESGAHKCVQGEQVTVAVMPVAPSAKVQLCEDDIRVDIFCSSGKGGQNINKVETAVRLTHLPTGIVVTCQDERSQLANKRRAMQRLQERLQQDLDRVCHQQYVEGRDSQVKDRSNAVRVYDKQKNAIRDPRTGLTVPLREGLKGNIHRLVVAAALKYRNE